MSFRRTDASAGTFGLQYGRILVFPLSLFTNNYFISDNSTITTNTPVAVVNNTYTPTNNKFHLNTFLTLFNLIFLLATLNASWSMSMATTLRAPSFAAVIARIPEPVPTSSTFFPFII